MASKTNLGPIIASRRDRLGARLITMLNSIRLAQDYGTDFKVNWFPKGADAPELDQPDQLFDRTWMTDTFLEAAAFEKLSDRAKPVWAFQNDKTPRKLKAHLDQGRAVLIEEGFGILVFPWEDEAQVQARYGNLLAQIRLQTTVATQMARIDTALSGKSVTAYHIRRGDILDTVPWKHATWTGKIEPDEYYATHIAAAPTDACALVFSDQPKTVTRLKAQFPALQTMADIVLPTGLSLAQRDLLELYAMSRADQIIAPRVSAFSIAAARLGGKERLTFAEALSDDQRTEADAHLLARLKQGAGAFLNPSEAAHIYARTHQGFATQIRTAPQIDQDLHNIAAQIVKAGADNAFLPILQALNCLHLERFAEGVAIAQDALRSPDLWPDEWASLMAIAATLFSGMDDRLNASQHMARAFWAKPLRPDVVILATRMIRRKALDPNLFPPCDWDVQRTLVRPYFTPFQNMFLVPWRMLRRRPSNFDLLLLDWPELTVDRKAGRLLADKARLQLLADWQEQVHRVPPDAPARQSLAALLDFRLGGDSAKAIAAMQSVLHDAPDSALYHKRLADIFEASGQPTRARDTLETALACNPTCPFVTHALGHLLLRQGDQKRGEALILHAAAISQGSDVAIQGDAGQIALRRGDHAQAVRFLTKAQELHPTHTRFQNQLKRARKNAT
ncbi:MAG: tetratricopeptide repeat protein [Yoonia sp.]|uniref:tetratricopeptide repeat protein n=1 Tax=Yoonia sp. TaxID=2212373 RepID=UPI003EFA1A38